MKQKIKLSHKEEFLRLLEGRKIISRRWSWVASSNNFFFKIPKLSESLKSDMSNPKALKSAREEYDNLIFLKRLCDDVVKPVDILEKYSCVIMDHIEGWDLLDELGNNNGPEALQLALEEGISLCALWHKYVPKESEKPPYIDYLNNHFYPAGDEVIRALRSHTYTIISSGYEIRNLMRDQKTNRLKFFDPHHLSLSAPEEDFTRFILSILMANWGKKMNLFIWNNFNFSRLVKVYEEARGAPLNKHILRYTFDLNVAMRKYFVEESIKQMKIYIRPVGLFYKKVYFYQINNWRNANGI